MTRRASHHSQLLPGQFSGMPPTAAFVQDEPPTDRDAQDSSTADELIPDYEALSWCWGEASDRPRVEIRIRQKNEYGHWQSYRMKIAWTLAAALAAAVPGARAQDSADLAVLAVHRLLGDPQQGADLGPAEAGHARTAYGDLLPSRQEQPGLSDRRQLVERAVSTVCVNRCLHSVSMC